MKVCRVLRPAVPFLLLISSLDGRSPAASKLPEKPNQVIVDVVVTDQSGQPVKGLREQDFRLFENDKRQKLDAFEEYAASAEPSAPPVPAKLPPNTFTNAASSAPDSINVILLDQLNTSEEHQAVGLREVTDFIARKPAGAAFAIFTLRNDDPSCTNYSYDPWSMQLTPYASDWRCTSLGRLTLVQGITHDKNRLLSALGSSLARPQSTSLREQLSRSWSAPHYSGFDGRFLDSGNYYGPLYYGRQLYGTDSYPSTLSEVYDSSMAWLAEIGHFLQNLPGRKSLIWMSDNFDAAPIAQYVEYWFPPKFKGWDKVDPYSPTMMTHLAADRLELARVALYPVDLTGKTEKIEVKRLCTFLWSQIRGTVFRRPLNVPVESGAGSCTAHYLDLNYVASQLGGVTFHSGEKIQKAITQVLNDESNYYTLTYSPNNKQFDGRVRDIKVSVGENGYHLAYRRRYWADDPSTVNRPDTAASQDIYLKNRTSPMPWTVVHINSDRIESQDPLSSATRWGAPESNAIIFTAVVGPTDKSIRATAAQMEQLQNYESFRSERIQYALEHMSAAELRGQHKGKGTIDTLPPADLTFVQPYSIDYYLDGKQLTLFQAADGSRLINLAVAILAYDESGKKVTGMEQSVAATFNISQLAKFQASDYHLHQLIQIPERTRLLRLALRDIRSNRFGSLEIPVRAISSPYERQKLELSSQPALTRHD